MGELMQIHFPLFVREHFASMFKKCPNRKGKLFLQDWDPLSNIVKKKLHQDALEMKIEREGFEEFSARVKRTLESVPVDAVDRTI